MKKAEKCKVSKAIELAYRKTCVADRITDTNSWPRSHGQRNTNQLFRACCGNHVDFIPNAASYRDGVDNSPFPREGATCHTTMNMSARQDEFLSFTSDIGVACKRAWVPIWNILYRTIISLCLLPTRPHSNSTQG